MERTLILLKPDAVQRALVGEIVTRFESKGLKIVGVKMLHVDEALARRHYAAHVDKPFFGSLQRFITSGPLVALALEGTNAISRVRSIVGATSPDDAAPGTVRGDLSADLTLNLIHASDAPETARAELSLFFADGELMEYRRCDEAWLGLAD
ncbi:nucleoside-diphosphate kinase [Candidatus Poribacteria bacterium]|nr:nucleoside-diphosphate kinase [Candidatus Poribacteria bacterium]MBT5534304.1 nucleoside-diphosphate kinase [Candidatus Poribacteria bacterium]MBT7100945.1 nucleoside-diphosphate kinase [Candidatus Poribacteria bacterium]MBT7803904.1 nucleoside-diphosphate kinase [Candidatus Poribacteria bacterium]